MIDKNIIWLMVLGGTVLFILLAIQILGGLGKIKFTLISHKNLGIILFFLAVLHAILGLYYLLS